MTTRPLALACALLAPALAHAEGAVVASRQGSTGMSINWPTPAEAEDNAIKQCEGRCTVIIHFKDQCAAVATGNTGGYGAAAKDSQLDADAEAIKICTEYGGVKCSVAQRACDGS